MIALMKTKVRTIQDVLRQAVLDLQAAKIESASLDARLLMQEAMGVTREQLMLAMDDTISAAALHRFDALVSRRLKREPVSKILGRREFYGMDFKVSIDTLDPRPDSETLVDCVLANLEDHAKPYRIIDLGVGTGCVSLALLKALPHASLVGVDCSHAALAIAQENALKLGLSSRTAFCLSNWFESVDGVFDVIVSNPPYIPSREAAQLAPEVAMFDPRLALDGGEDGLDAYRTLLQQASVRRQQGGLIAVEIGAGQHLAVSQIAAASGLGEAQMFKDLAGIIRCLLWKN